ncbi:protein shisa-like-2B [Homarus americanus]|uniref:protein shisa-like-2B n=1 Tax=Homarus americanus TaxID=6706 RepID=UPI001C4647CB|nr:protein shisa-like-2B [Homarus americanus]
MHNSVGKTSPNPQSVLRHRRERETLLSLMLAMKVHMKAGKESLVDMLAERVLGEDYCSGYIDTFGKWSNGFPCPSLESEEPVYCCGTDNFKYCCTKRDMHALTHDIPQLPLILGVVFGVAVAFVVIVVVSCFHCSCCLLYKKRQPTNGGPLYQMHCSSTASGVANMYSFSGTTTPSETPRSLSSCSSAGHADSMCIDELIINVLYPYHP